jgi:tetratricopeptide (TPR) repeat protein
MAQGSGDWKQTEKENRESWRLGTEGGQAALPVVVVATLAVLYFVNVPAILASRQVIVAISPGEQPPLERIEQFKKAINYGSFGNAEIREQLVSYFSRLVQEPSISPDVKNAFFNYTKEQMAIQLERTPEDARYQLFTGTFYHNAAFLDKKYLAESLTYFENARALSPKKQSILFEIGATYINNQEYKKAFDLLKETYELEPSYDEAKFLYALSAVYAGNNTLANELFATLPSSALSDQRLSNAYLQTKQYAALKTLLENRVKQTPDDVQLHISLAAVYMQLNERANAIKELEAIKKINPAFKDQADAYIQQIREGKNPTQ